MKTFLFFIGFLLTVLGTSTASGNVSEEGVNVAEELFHRRVTVVEDFGSKSAVIEVHLTSIDMLVSVTVDSVDRKTVSSFTTAYLPGKTFTNETEMDEKQQIDMVNPNQPPRTTMAIQRDAAGNNSTWLAPAWNSFLNAVKSVLKWLYIGIEWPKDINSDAFVRRTVTASDSTCPADGIANYSMFMDTTDKDQTTCPVAHSIQLMTLIDSKSDSKSLSKKSEDGKVNTTLQATSLENRETNVTASPGKAEREVNEIKENKRREPIVIFMGHSDSEELSKDESCALPKFTSSPFSGLHPEIRSSNRQENDVVMFLGDSDSDHDTVTSLDRDEDEIQSTALGVSSTEKPHPKEKGLALQQKDTEIGTFALLDEPPSTLRNETLSDLVDPTNQTTNRSEKADERSDNVKMVNGTLISSNQDQTGASPLKKVHSGVCRIEQEHPDGHINDLTFLTTQHQDILFLRGSIAKKSQISWMTKQVIDESVICLTGLNQSGPETKRCISKAVRRLTETSSLRTRIWNQCAAIVGCGMKSNAVSLQATTMMRKQDKWTAQASPVNVSRMCLKASKPTGLEICAKESSPSVVSSWFIVRLWNRGLLSVGLRKPSSVPRQTAKRPQYQLPADVPVNVFEICMSEINQTGSETSFCTTKAARRLAESQWFTTKLWNKGVASMRWIRSNETQEKARNLTNLYLTRVVTTMLNWTWQDTFDVMTIILVTDYCCTALYLAVPYIFNIITRLIRMLIREWRLYRENQRRKLEEERERLRQEELARERASQPKPWRPKQPRRRKANFCGRLQKW